MGVLGVLGLKPIGLLGSARVGAEEDLLSASFLRGLFLPVDPSKEVGEWRNVVVQLSIS